MISLLEAKTLCQYPTKLPAPILTGGAEDGTRTRDLLITNQLLYQLSYFGVYEGKPRIPAHCFRFPISFCIPGKIGIRI